MLSVLEPFAGGFVLLLLGGLLLGLVTTVAWILMMVDAAQKQFWVWFVLMIVFPIAAVAYFVVEYDNDRSAPTRRRARPDSRRRFGERPADSYRDSLGRDSRDRELDALQKELEIERLRAEVERLRRRG